MTLPRRISKPAKRASRWRSPAHCNFVRSHACSCCGAVSAIEVAHIRLGSGAGMSQKPDDWRTVSLCRECHRMQHQHGEDTFWEAHRKLTGQTVDELIAEFSQASPKSAEIRRIQAERLVNELV